MGKSASGPEIVLQPAIEPKKTANINDESIFWNMVLRLSLVRGMVSRQKKPPQNPGAFLQRVPFD